MTTPPTIRELLDDEAFRKFMKKRPRLPKHLQHGTPWVVWMKTTRNTWAKREFELYDDAWRTVVDAVRDHDEYKDASLVSKRVLYPPSAVFPPGWIEGWEALGFAWCGRCRRPSYFRYSSEKHHALRRYPVVTLDSPYRCYYCGQRRITNIYTEK